MDLGIGGRAALVLGASSGIGAAVALALAHEGVRLAVAARRTDRLGDVARQAEAAGAADARTYFLDLADESVAATFEAIGKQMDGIDILVLNGGGPKAGRFSDMSLAEWDAGYRLVLRSMLAIVLAALPAMRAKRWGRIVALTSTSVKQPIDTLVLSNAFRTALVAALRTLANEVAAEGITVNCIATGRIDTDRLRALYPSEEESQRAAASEIPMKRIATPGEFAPMVAFLCSEGARYVTAQTISIDGGLTRGLFG
jgi:3-oxoacyl-[acyl-carrier protein] reductase